ncbi:MAG: AlpA family phage regulatory protein [Myxococcota bacterium]
MDRLIGIRQLCHRVGRSRRTIDNYLSDPSLHFPRPVRLGARDRAWHAAEVERWVKGLPLADETVSELHLPPAA